MPNKEPLYPHVPKSRKEPRRGKIGIYGAWVWRVPSSTSEAVIEALSALGEFPPPQTEGWKLLRLEAGTFGEVEEALQYVPEGPGTYVVAIGHGDKMSWELVRH